MSYMKFYLQSFIVASAVRSQYLKKVGRTVPELSCIKHTVKLQSRVAHLLYAFFRGRSRISCESNAHQNLNKQLFYIRKILSEKFDQTSGTIRQFEIWYLHPEMTLDEVRVQDAKR